MYLNSEQFCLDRGANVVISGRRNHRKPSAAVVELDGAFESASVRLVFLDFQRRPFSSGCIWHHIWTSVLPLWFFRSDSRAGIPFRRDWSDYIRGGDLLRILVACYPRVQHTLGCLPFNNSSLAFDQHCFSLFQSCFHISRTSSSGNQCRRSEKWEIHLM